jgi:hypothetical protein
MLFNVHSEFKDRHSFLSPSKYAWVNYSEEKLEAAYANHLMAARGTALHAFAHEAIRLGVRLPTSRKTLNLYVNDGIRYQMITEQVLFYSDNCWGTCDTIQFRRRLLRIHDLKTGLIPGSVRQLEIYAALFCLEYRVDPFKIDMELRIYQNDECQIFTPTADTIVHIMDRIITFDDRIAAMRSEGL